MSASPGADDEPIELFDGSRAISESDVTSGSNPMRTLLSALAALAVVATLTWSLVSNDDDGPVEPGGSSESAEADPTTQTTVAPTTTTTTAIVNKPVLDGPSGLWLFYGGTDPLQRLDLDTGVIDRYGLRAWPLVATGGELVVVANGSGSVGWVSLDDPGEQAVGWTNAQAARSERPGHVWLLNSDPPAWSLMDITRSRAVEQRPVPEQIWTSHQSGLAQRHLLPGTDLVDTPNGIYQLDGDGYRRVGEGRILDFDQERALVEQCGETLDDCRLQWFDRGTWQPLDLPLPSLPISSARLLGNGSWVRSVRPDGQGSELISLETETRLELGGGDSFALSPDGRWLAFTQPEQGLSLIDLNAGSVVRHVDAFADAGHGVLIFVDRN